MTVSDGRFKHNCQSALAARSTRTKIRQIPPIFEFGLSSKSDIVTEIKRAHGRAAERY